MITRPALNQHVQRRGRRRMMLLYDCTHVTLKCMGTLHFPLTRKIYLNICSFSDWTRPALLSNQVSGHTIFSGPVEKKAQLMLTEDWMHLEYFTLWQRTIFHSVWNNSWEKHGSWNQINNHLNNYSFFPPFTHIFNTYYRQEVYTNPFILVQLWNN